MLLTEPHAAGGTLPTLAAAAQADPASTAWLLVCTALVMIMTPGVAFFYAGLVRARHVLTMLMQAVAALAVISLLWVLVGYSLAFAAGNDVVGDLSISGLVSVDRELGGLPADLPVPPMAYVAFQMMFAVVTAVLVIGATADRWRFAAFVPFVALWSLLVYAPVAHWVFASTGWAARMGALDFAGGLVVHVTAGATGLAVTLVLGRRRGWPDAPMRPHNLPLVVLGAFLLWFGWFGFNAGSALRPDAVAASAVVTSNTAAAAGVLGWTLVERLRYGRPTLLGAVSGGIAGLVAVTPCSGYVTPLSGLLVGLAAGLVCAGAVSLKVWFGVDDSLDVVAVHLVGGAVGTLALGLLATRDVNPSGRDGLFYGGGYDLLAAQALALLVVAVFAFTASYVLAGVLDRLIGNRVRPRDEDTGLDLALHGETAYSGLELATDASEASSQERSVRR